MSKQTADGLLEFSCDDRRRIIYTRATAATVYRWATSGKRRRRNKYRNALTVCRVLNRREAPVLGIAPNGYGLLGHVKLEWGEGHLRDCGPWLDIHVNPGGATERYWGWHNTESRRVLRGRQNRTTQMNEETEGPTQ